MTIIQVVLAIVAFVTIILWANNKNAGWAFPTAVITFLVATLKGGVPLWITIIFWMLIAVGVVLFIATKPVIFKRVAIIAMLVAVVAVGIAYSGSHSNSKISKIAPPDTKGQLTWKMTEGDYGNNRWFADGIVEIADAKNNTEAADAANVWLDRVKTDPNLLAGAVKYFLKRDVDKNDLVTSDGWATDKAVQLTSELQILLAQSKIVAENAPASGYNSGVENNTVVGANTAGISGNTKAIKVTTPDNKNMWIMARCGNVVTPEKPSTPPGKTDNTPPTPTPAPTTPPKTVIILPTPTPTPTPTPEHHSGGHGGGGHWSPPIITPKSNDIVDYQRPGTDNTRDSGTGVKPKVPTVTTPPESAPPSVTTTVINSVNDIVDTATNEPGSATGVTAPEATPVTSPVATPPVEPSVNPTDNGVNDTAISNPFE